MNVIKRLAYWIIRKDSVIQNVEVRNGGVIFSKRNIVLGGNLFLGTRLHTKYGEKIEIENGVAYICEKEG